jgi:Mrp family chromosome partitioning ATPase
MQTVIVASLKGGVGKSTVTLGLAQALHRGGKRVGILDLDYRSPVIPLLLGADGAGLGRTSDDALVPPVIDGISVMSMAFLWPPAKAIMVEDSLAVGDVRQMLTPGAIAWPADLDYLVVDSPPSSSGIVLAILSLPDIAGSLIVSHPSTASRAALLRTLDLFAEKQVPIYGLVSNQGVDEHGQLRFDLQDQDIIDLAALHDLPWCFCIPHARELIPHFDGLAACVLSTHPVVLAKPKEPEGERWHKLVELARKLTQQSTRSAS